MTPEQLQKILALVQGVGNQVQGVADFQSNVEGPAHDVTRAIVEQQATRVIEALAGAGGTGGLTSDEMREVVKEALREGTG